MTRKEIKLAGELVAACLYRYGIDPGESQLAYAWAFAESCPRLRALASDWHFRRVVSTAKRELAGLVASRNLLDWGAS
jgi:hypothetical protein